MRPRDSSWSANCWRSTDGHGTHVEVDGVIYQRHEPGIVRYFTLCGAVDIERWTYREMGRTRADEASGRAVAMPDGAVAISLGLDRTSVPMEEDVPAGETPVDASARPELIVWRVVGQPWSELGDGEDVSLDR